MAGRALLVCNATGGGISMQSDTHFYMVWAHRSPDSIFGAASTPVVRNGVFLCFDTEERARAETDRLNARSGGTHLHYSVKPTPGQMALPRGLAKGATAEPQFAMPLSSAPCTVSSRVL
jgi:hypothetical protein